MIRDAYKADVWWRPGQISFTYEQTLWLIEYIELISQGLWPPQGDRVATRTRQLVAPFQAPIEVWVELDTRLKKTGADGKLLIKQVALHEIILERESRNALFYILGRNPKRMSYLDWMRSRRKRIKQRAGEYQPFAAAVT